MGLVLASLINDLPSGLISVKVKCVTGGSLIYSKFEGAGWVASKARASDAQTRACHRCEGNKGPLGSRPN